jgi:predicted O-linked N-acetylglucosamine transferase (SPINDLY family)
MPWIDKELDAALEEHRRGELAQAQKRYRRVLAEQPNHPDAVHLLGLLLHQSGRCQDGIALMRRSIELRPGVAAFHYNLGKALGTQRLVDGAIVELSRAVDLDPNLPDAWVELGSMYRAQGRLEEAIEAYSRGARMAPTGACASALFYTLWFSPRYDPGRIVAEHRRWAGRFADPLSRDGGEHRNDRTIGRRLRVGYVSPDFREHVVGRYVVGLLERHDPSQVEAFAYSDTGKTDGMTGRIRGCVHGWRDTRALSHEKLCDVIRADGIDILVDLTSHTIGNRLPTFARKPAPIQVTYLAYPATTGLAAMDYRITDRYLDPPGMTEALHTEKLARLPGSYWTYPLPAHVPQVGALPADANGYITFGSLNTFAKITDPVLRLWGRILNAVPDSRLRLLLPGLPANNRPVVTRIERNGILLSRVVFDDFQPVEAHLRSYQQIDLVLDPFPYPGHTTSLDALFMGVPLVTIGGQTPISRAGVSLLNNLGLPELIASDEEQYLNIATALSADRERLASLRRGMRDRFMASSLTDVAGATRSLERAYRIMWERWCRGEEPDAINV